MVIKGGFLRIKSKMRKRKQAAVGGGGGGGGGITNTAMGLFTPAYTFL